MLVNWTRKISLEIIRLTKELRYAVSREDLINLIKSLKGFPKIIRLNLL